jgi:hypothetical protein
MSETELLNEVLMEVDNIISLIVVNTLGILGHQLRPHIMEQDALKNVNNCLNTNISFYLDTSGHQNSNLSLNGL